MQVSCVAVITAVCPVQYRAVIPHNKHVGLPLVGVLEFLSYLPGVEIQDQLLCLVLLHALDGADVAYGAEQCFGAALWVCVDDGMALGL